MKTITDINLYYHKIGYHYKTFVVRASIAQTVEDYITRNDIGNILFTREGKKTVVDNSYCTSNRGIKMHCSIHKLYFIKLEYHDDDKYNRFMNFLKVLDRIHPS